MPKLRTFAPVNRVRELRTGLGLKLKDLATITETSLAQVQRLETGDRDLDVPWMRKIAPSLNVAPADLLLHSDGGLNGSERNLIEAYRERPETHEAIHGLLFNRKHRAV